jgi:hypothetical protein
MRSLTTIAPEAMLISCIGLRFLINLHVIISIGISTLAPKADIAPIACQLSDSTR